MKQAFYCLVVISVCFPLIANSQNRNLATITGKLVNRSTKNAISAVNVAIPVLSMSATSNGDGIFTLKAIPYGSYRIIMSSGNIKSDTITVMINKKLVDLKAISLATDSSKNEDNSDIPSVMIEDFNQNNDNEQSGQNAEGLFAANNDLFLFAAASTFIRYHYRPRGFNSMELQMNGIDIIDLEKGFVSWSQLGGLNDVLHNRTVNYGLKPSAYSYGSIQGSIYLDATAADQRKGTTLTYSASNRLYRNRIMLTHNNGLLQNGWAYSASASKSWANEGYTPGTFYDGYSFYGAVSKVINKSQFNLTAIGSNFTRGKSSYATDEAYDLANDRQYNPNWGYQQGRKRNAKVADIFLPKIIANYTYRPSERTRWNTALGYETGWNNSSTLDFYNANSPYPDYYRNLPSYYETMNPPKSNVGAALRGEISGHPEQLQINWDDLYNANYINNETIKNVDGISGNNVTGRRSLYVISNYVDKVNKVSFNTNIEHAVNARLTLFGGLKFASQTDEYYKQLMDLMGGDFYVNYNQFATQQSVSNPYYSQNDLKHPNRLIKLGDKYGYHYKENISTGNAWGQATVTYNKLDLFAALSSGITTFGREGFMQNGLFPNNSFGTSPSLSFLTYKVKGGFTYKLDLHNILFVNADYSVEPPKVANTYISVSTRDYIVDNPKSLNIKSLELGYLMTSPSFNAHITGYATDITDATTIMRFFNDDPTIQSFVNYVMNDVSVRSIGTEISGIYKLSPTLSIAAIAAIGQTFYTNSPIVTIFQDNDPTMTSSAHKVYIKNYYTGVGPQSIYSMNVKYSPRNYWHAAINFNYSDRNYISINPDRHTPQAAALVTAGSDQWHNILDQEKLPGAFTVDLHAGKSLDIRKIYKKLDHKTIVKFNLGIVNLLNNKNIKSGGYEQLRYDFTNRNPNKFPNKYEYAFGFNFYLNLSLNF